MVEQQERRYANAALIIKQFARVVDYSYIQRISRLKPAG